MYVVIFQDLLDYPHHEDLQTAVPLHVFAHVRLGRVFIAPLALNLHTLHAGLVILLRIVQVNAAVPVPKHPYTVIILDVFHCLSIYS